MGHATYTPQDVILASGCSGALELAITTLVGPGQTILLPSPGFSIYHTICANRGIQAKNYQCLPDRQWEVDLTQLESLVDSSTRAILVNNPSNPCGSVFSKDHLMEILALAERHKLPIISDEVYEYMVFPPAVFHPLASLSTSVPILTCTGMAKKFIVPGWRIGWVLIHSPNQILDEVGS